MPPAPALRCAAWAPAGWRAVCGQKRRRRRAAPGPRTPHPVPAGGAPGGAASRGVWAIRSRS